MPSRPNPKRSRKLGLTVEGRHPVLEALRAGTPVTKIVVAEDIESGRQMAEILDLANAAAVPVEPIPRKQLDRAAATKHHQGVIAVTPDPDYASLDDLISRVHSSNRPGLIVVLDGITDPQNLGAIVRTAECAGAHGAVIPARRAVGITAGVRRASAGAVEHLPLARVTNLVRALERLRDERFWVLGLAGDVSRAYTEADFSQDAVLVIGAEGQGLSRLVRETCDELISIPLVGRVASLNASAAAAIALYEAVRQRERVSSG